VPTSVSIISRQQRLPLAPAGEAGEATVVAAEYLTIEVESDAVPPNALLDGQQVQLVRNDAGTRGLLSFDAFRSVGFHSLRVGEEEFFFATEDAKLKLDGILTLLAFLKHEGLSWRGPLFFSDGSAVRHPKVDHAWLARMAARILATADAIADRPLRRLRETRVVQTPGAGRLFLTDTFALLRGNPRALLEPQDTGVINLAGRRYAPRAVVGARQERSFDTIGNRRMTQVLQLAHELCLNLAAEPHVPRHVQQALGRTSADLTDRLDLFPFSALELLPSQLPMRPAPEELADDRYADSFALHEELLSELAWEAGLRVADRFAYVAFADQIYQAFVAVVLASGFGAKQVSSSMHSGLTVPLFRSDDHDIYYDTSPPRPEFSSWRDESSRPTDQKPDLTIVDRASRRGILLDAKYRVEPSGRMTPSALEEAQVYLQSFERKAIAICYPGKELAISRVSGKGYTVLEVSLGPYAGVEEFARTTVRPALESLLEPIGNYV
jgi:hypothetical protein